MRFWADCVCSRLTVTVLCVMGEGVTAGTHTPAWVNISDTCLAKRTQVSWPRLKLTVRWLGQQNLTPGALGCSADTNYRESLNIWLDTSRLANNALYPARLERLFGSLKMYLWLRNHFAWRFAFKSYVQLITKRLHAKHYARCIQTTERQADTHQSVQTYGNLTSLNVYPMKSLYAIKPLPVILGVVYAMTRLIVVYCTLEGVVYNEYNIVEWLL